MRIKVEKLPFYSILTAAALPWINGFTNSNIPGYVFNILLISVTCICLVANQRPRLTAVLGSWVFAVCFCFAVVMMFILHRFHPLADFMAIVLVVLTYNLLLKQSLITSVELLRQLRVLYAFHVAFIVLELLLFIFDLRPLLNTLSGGRYRELSFHLLGTALGIGPGLPNSLLLQAQAASHLVGCAVLVFFSTPSGGRGNAYLLLGLLALFLILITNTSLLIFVFLGAAVWIAKAKPISRIAVLLLTTVAGILFLDEIFAVVFYRIAVGAAENVNYLWYFTVPISNLAGAQPWQLLFGHGLATEALDSGEIGFATIAFVAGIYLVGLLFAWLASILSSGLLEFGRGQRVANSEATAWRFVLALNILLCAAWGLSTAHYMIVLIPGGLHLFAFSLAIVLVASSRVRDYRRHATRVLAETPASPYGAPSHG